MENARNSERKDYYGYSTLGGDNPSVHVSASTPSTQGPDTPKWPGENTAYAWMH